MRLNRKLDLRMRFSSIKIIRNLNLEVISFETFIGTPFI